MFNTIKTGLLLKEAGFIALRKDKFLPLTNV